MSKEKILKEFNKIFENLKLKDIQITGLLILLNKAIDQTEEETIRKVEEMIGDFNWYSAPQDLLVTFGLDKEGTRHKLRAENLKQSLNKLKK